MKNKLSIANLSIIVLLIFIACSESNSLDTDKINALEITLGVSPSTAPFEGDYLFFNDVMYGAKERNRLDILLPKSDFLNATFIERWRKRERLCTKSYLFYSIKK